MLQFGHVMLAVFWIIFNILSSVWQQSKQGVEKCSYSCSSKQWVQNLHEVAFQSSNAYDFTRHFSFLRKTKKVFSKILSNRSIIRIKMRLQNRYGHFLAVHTVQHWHKRFLRIIDWNRLRILFIPEMPCLIQNFHQNYWKFFISQLYRGGLENQTKESAAAGSAVCERPSGGGDDGGPGC